MEGDVQRFQSILSKSKLIKMKTFFNEEEIYKFLTSKKSEIVGDSVLVKVLSQMEKPDLTSKGLTPEQILEIAMNYSYELGKKQGELQGRVNIWVDMVEFFEADLT